MRKPDVAGPLELFLSLASIMAIFWLVNPSAVLGILSSANIPLALAALAAYFCTMLLMSHRIRLVLAALGRRIGFSEAFFANAAGLLASDFTPARSGYFVTPFVLSRNSGVPLERGMVAIVSPQIIEFFLKACGAAAAIMLIVYSFPEFSSSVLLLWLGVGVMLAFCAAMGIALFVPAFVGIARKFSFLPFVPQGCDFLASLQRHRKGVARIFPQIIAISSAIFFLKGIEWYLFGLSLGIGFSVPAHPFLVFLLLQPLITVFQFAPFPTIAGIGISEGSAVASMSLLGVPIELAIAYTFLVRAGTTMLDLIGIRQAASFVLPKG